jgi:hypothetical protein
MQPSKPTSCRRYRARKATVYASRLFTHMRLSSFFDQSEDSHASTSGRELEQADAPGDRK